MDDLVKRLRAVDHISVEDCFLQSPLYGHAADAIEALQARVAELEIEAERRDEQILDMIEASGQTCACGYDKASDICLGHLSHFRKSVATARRDAFEEAAKVADKRGFPTCADAIRALAEKE